MILSLTISFSIQLGSWDRKLSINWDRKLSFLEQDFCGSKRINLLLINFELVSGQLKFRTAFVSITFANILNDCINNEHASCTINISLLFKAYRSILKKVITKNLESKQTKDH